MAINAGPSATIPLHYQHNLLLDIVRLESFKTAIDHVVKPGAKVLELGGGSGVLSFFAAQKASKVYCVETLPEVVEASRNFFALNGVKDRIEVIQADAFEYLPPEPVDVVICEMVHAALLVDSQIKLLEKFKERYKKKFNAELPIFVPEAVILALQPVRYDYNFAGFKAPIVVFQQANVPSPRTTEMAHPAVTHIIHYSAPEFNKMIQWTGNVTFIEPGECNAIRFVTKNILAILVESNSTVDWFSQYLLLPLREPLQVQRGQTYEISFSYQAGGEIQSLQNSLQIKPVA